MNFSKNKRVLVAMSGGVDSSVAAALLKEVGFEVIGVFMKFWTEPEKDSLSSAWNRCCSPEAEKTARKVANILDIPIYVFDFKREFKSKIVDVFLKKTKKGVTPNPCVLCNREIKFGLLLKKAKALGANFIATGHYARLKGKEDKTILMRAKDKKKDQSYFLWKLGQHQLKYILFPVGGYTKTEVKKMAKGFKLGLSKIPESQEICFIQTTTNNFLKKFLKTKPGKIIDASKKVIGQHQGLWFYTIGQRKGIIPHLDNRWKAEGPFYVLDKDFKKNFLIVVKNKKDLYKKEIVLKNVNWISGKLPKLPIKVKTKIRYRHEAAEAVVSKLRTGRYGLEFKKPQLAVTPGQSAVFYKRNEVLGGGIIC